MPFGLAFSPQVYHAELWRQRIQRVGVDSAFAKLTLGWNGRTEAGSRAAPAAAEVRLKAEFAPDAVYGTYFRVGREGSGRTFPVSGGTLREAGMSTPRAINFKKIGNEMAGQGGQTSTQIVLLKKPIPESFMILPLGQDSRHFDDQAEKLFSKSKAKSTYFMNRKELQKHVAERKELSF